MGNLPRTTKMNDSKLAGKLKAQIKRFSKHLTQDLTKPQRRFISEMLYGIQASKDVKISNISRSLNGFIPLIKTSFSPRQPPISECTGTVWLLDLWYRRALTSGLGSMIC